MRGTTQVHLGPIHLGGLLDRLLRDTMTGTVPGIEDMNGAGTLSLDGTVDFDEGAYRAHGRIALEGASLDDPSQGLSVKKIEAALPFSLVSAPAPSLPRTPAEAPDETGALTVEGIDYKGLTIPRIHARVLVTENRLALAGPVRVAFAGGTVHLPEFALRDLGTGRPQGRAALEIDRLDLAPIAQAATGKAVEGRLEGRFDRLTLDHDAWTMAGRLSVRIRDGELRAEGIEIEAPLAGRPSGRCEIRAAGLPLEALSGGFIGIPVKGTLDGRLPTVEFSGGRLETEGSFVLSAFGGTVTVSGVRAAGLFGPTPVGELDVDLEEIDLGSLTSPLDFGSISGVLEGRVHGLRVRPEFPYAQAFDADLETVRRQGVPRKIDATAVETLARIGGSGQLASVLSRGLYRFFDEYYYRKMGLRATLEDGWLELPGIPKGKKEYLVVRGFRIPTLSMPITVMTRNRKIRFQRWLSDVMRVGREGTGIR
jgi:hypothetical protein